MKSKSLKEAIKSLEAKKISIKELNEEYIKNIKEKKHLNILFILMSKKLLIK